MADVQDTVIQDPPDKLKDFYNALRSNTNVKGLPSDYDTFKGAMQDPNKSQAFYSSISQNENIQGVPKNYDTFATGLGLKKNSGGGVSGGLNPNANLLPDQNTQSVSPVLPQYQQQVQDRQAQDVAQQAQANQRISDNLKAQQSALDPEHREAFGRAMNAVRPPDQLTDGKEGLAHYNAMQTPIGKTLGALKYIGSKATKGTLQVAKGAAYLAQLGANPTMAAAGQFGSPEVDAAFKKADENTNFGLTKGDEQRMQDSPVISNLGGLAEFLPSAAAASSTGGATFYLQGIGQGKEAMDKVEESGAHVDPTVKGTFILGTGLVNGALMGELGSSMFKTLPAGLRGDITASITADAIKNASGKELTGDAFKSLLDDGAKTFADKLRKGGISTLEGYKHAVTNLSALTGANFALKKGVDMANDKPVFNETAGDLASQLNDVATKQAPMFAIPAAIGAATKLTPYSDYKNTVVESLMHDSSPENIERTKTDISNYGQRNEWTPQEIQDTQAHVDKIGDVARSLPKNIAPAKVTDAVDLVTNRKQLESELATEQAQRKTLDPAVADIVSPNEQMLSDKIEQANDKLRDIVTGNKTTYSKGIGEDEGKFFKKVSGSDKLEEISPSRYQLENTERSTPKTTDNESTNEKNGEESSSQSSEESNTESNGKGNEKVADGNDEKGLLKESGEAKVEPDLPELKTIELKGSDEQSIDQGLKLLSEKEQTPEVKSDTEKLQDYRDKIEPVAQVDETNPNTEAAPTDVENETDTLNNATPTAETPTSNSGEPASVTEPVQSAEAESEKTEGNIKDPASYDTVEPPSEADKPTEAIYGTKNAITEDLQKGLGLPPIEIPKDRTDDESLAAWKSGKRTPNDIVSELLDPNTGIYDKSITPNDESVMREYIRQLGERGKELNKTKAHLQEKGDEADVASVSQQIDRHLDEYNDALNASKVGGNIWHKYGDERQKAIDDKGLIQNGIDRIQNIYGSEIPKEIAAELKDLRAKYDNLEAKNALLEQRIKDVEAKRALESNRPKTERGLFGTKRIKKTNEQFEKERKDIVSDMRNDLKKSLGQLNTTLPGAPQFNAIAPHIARLLKSFAEQGATKLDDVIVKIHDVVKDVVSGITKDDVRDIIAGKFSDKRTLPELTKEINKIRQQARLVKQIAELEKGIREKSKGRSEESSEVAKLKERVAELKKQAPNEFAYLSAEDLQKRAATIQKQIDKGDFFKIPTVKRTWERDPEWIKNNKEKNALTEKLRKMEAEAMDSKKSKLMRSLDWTNRWGRRIIFFGANAVYTKLASAAVLGSLVHRIPEQIGGAINAKLFPHIAKNAPIEGQMNAIAEGKFYSEFLNPKKFIKNTYDIAKTGGTELSRELGRHGTENHIPILDLFAADAHIMIKDPVKRAAFESSLINHLKWYEQNGIDGTHPMMLESARQAAYKRAEYEIFQNSDPKSNKVKEFFRELEKSGVMNRNMPDGFNKLKGNAQYTAASIYHFFVPINTVPVNILKRVGLGLVLPVKYIEAATKNRDVRNGVLKMSSEESDAILLHLKKGNVMAAYWGLGFALAGASAGGLYTNFYSNKDRDKSIDTQDADYLNVGMDIPKDVQHNTQFQALQMGATWRIVHDHYIDDKNESNFMADFAATAATAGVAAKQHPMIDFAAKAIDAVQTPHGNTKFVKDLKRRVGYVKAANVLGAMGYNVDSGE